MKLPLKWLNEYVEADLAPEELADKLLNAGFEVEEIIRLDKGVRGIVAGRVAEIFRHENAQKLWVCKIDAGNGSPVTICTAATNVFAGAYVPVATDGAVLADGTDIRAVDMRGVTSYGMLCSGKELGIDDTVYPGAETDGIMILNEAYAPGTGMLAVLGLDDVVLNISVTANRPDCQSVYGMAREVAAILDKPLKPLALDFKAVSGGAGLSAAVENAVLCPRYTAQCVNDIRIAPSPDFIAHRLRACGIRPINNIVDITNYVLLEVGQPLHAFDINLLEGRKIVVRNAAADEKITALDGKEYTLTENMLVIADAEKPVAVAGVMGGEYSGITSGTNGIALESARFARGTVRMTSRALGLRSDSSARFERGVDQASPGVGLHRALHLIGKLNCGKILQTKIDIGGEPAKKTIKFQVKEISGILGIPVPESVVSDVLRRLSITHTIMKGAVTAVIPPYRTDLDNGADIAEEVIRIWGYDKLKPAFMKKARPTVGGKPASIRNSDMTKAILTGLNAYEISTYSFIPPSSNQRLMLKAGDGACSHVKIANPLGEEFSLMRANLAHGLLTASEYNFRHKNSALRLFEYGRVYGKTETGFSETNTIGLAAAGQDEDFLSLKGIVQELGAAFNAELGFKRTAPPFLHPGKSAEIYIDGAAAGYLGEAHPIAAKNYGLTHVLYIAEINFDALTKGYDGRIAARELPKFPAVERDLALVMNADTEVGKLISALKKTDPLIEDIILFDIYQGHQIADGQKSAAFRVVLQDYSATLTDERTNAVMEKILRTAEINFGAVLRA